MSHQGISEVQVWLDDPTLGAPALVGKLLRREGRRGDTVHFEYDSQWTAAPKTGVRPFELDPQLPVYGGQITARAGADQLTGGVPGLLSGSLFRSTEVNSRKIKKTTGGSDA